MGVLDIEYPFTVPLVQVNINEDTSELKSCHLYVKSNLQTDEEGEDKDCSNHIERYRILEKFPETKNILTEYVNEVLTETIGYDSKFVITTSWITLTTKNSKSQNHIHRNSFWSGVYYFDDDYGSKTGRIVFRNPIYQLSSFVPRIEEFNSVTATEIFVKPTSNKLILFPSYVYHQVELHQEEDDRHSLAFNIVPTGLYGVGDSMCDTSWIN